MAGKSDGLCAVLIGNTIKYIWRDDILKIL